MVVGYIALLNIIEDEIIETMHQLKIVIMNFMGPGRINDEGDVMSLVYIFTFFFNNKIQIFVTSLFHSSVHRGRDEKILIIINKWKLKLFIAGVLFLLKKFYVKREKG